MKKKIVFSLFTIILIIFAPTMFHSLLISMPFMVCAFMAVQLCLECRLHPERRPLKWLAAWAIACTLLYGGHYVYFHRATWLMPVSDTIYATMNLTVYPLYLIYISELTDMRPISSRPARLVILTICPSWQESVSEHYISSLAKRTRYDLSTPTSIGEGRVL